MITVKDGKAEYKLDTDKDGTPSISAKIDLSEALQELISKGKSIEGAKVANISFSGTSLSVKIDTDKDGENSFEFNVNLIEAFDEGSNIFKKS